jgi:hypothetical protein
VREGGVAARVAQYPPVDWDFAQDTRRRMEAKGWVDRNGKGIEHREAYIRTKWWRFLEEDLTPEELADVIAEEAEVRPYRCSGNGSTK